MKTIKVVAAVICNSLENTTKIFATAKGHGEFKGRWEFPGGKLEAGGNISASFSRIFNTIHTKNTLFL